MTRSITAVWTAALCAIAMAAAQPAAANGQTTSATAKVPPKTGAPAKASTPAKTSAPAPSASLTGCLHADGSKFMLTGLEGKQAPKGRSWKTGFIAKTGKDVEVVGTSSTVKLKDQVGHKVTVMGTRDGETHFKAQSVKQISRSCS